MISLGGHPTQLGIARDEAPLWGRDLIDAGRDAAFVDTGYLRALIDDSDDLHPTVAEHWRLTRAIFYTTPLVVAEAVRQVAKHGGADQQWRWARVDETKVLVSDDRVILVCAPTEEVVRSAMTQLAAMQRELVRLDLCDCLSMVILDTLKHRRVLGFDNHFRSVGAALEPS